MFYSILVLHLLYIQMQSYSQASQARPCQRVSNHQSSDRSFLPSSTRNQPASRPSTVSEYNEAKSLCLSANWIECIIYPLLFISHDWLSFKLKMAFGVLFLVPSLPFHSITIPTIQPNQPSFLPLSFLPCHDFAFDLTDGWMDWWIDGINIKPLFFVCV